MTQNKEIPEAASNFEFDRRYRDQGYTLLCGVDEAGRGPLAGPVYAAAVILDPSQPIEGLDDSKKLTAKKRDLLFDEIQQKALSFSIASASVEEIELMNILQATFLAMQRAVERLSEKPQRILVDGNRLPPSMTDTGETVVKGDAKSASIAAASILAKVARDRYMMEMDAIYPDYQFNKHKGYGTKLHYEAIREHGPSPIHRLSFLRKFFDHEQRG